MSNDTLASRSSINSVASEEKLQTIASNLTPNGFRAIIVDTGAEALEKIKELIPRGASVMNGTSTTLKEIGFIDYLKSDSHGWNNLHAPIVAEKDPAKQRALRMQALAAEYYVGSAHAVTEDGELVIASASGSQLPHYVHTSPNLVLVVGAQKAVPTLNDAFDRIREEIVPQEEKRMRDVTEGAMGTIHAKTVVLHREPAFMGRTITVILVKEALGF